MAMEVNENNMTLSNIMRIVDTFKFYTPQTTNKLLVFGLTHKAILLKRWEFA